ncbi:MAG TPA: hypothetical protein VFX21_13785, partial [Acidimicrobiia bacterium]|nr:hypothetical protein [Acidimicrobiia bacterium]
MTPEDALPLADKVIALNAALARSDFDYAFGGALALAYHVEDPRGTRDIDINIFVSADRAEEVFRSLPTEVIWDAADLRTTLRDGQVRLFWGDTPVDLFLSTHEFHDEASLSTREVPFDGARIPILGATELTVFKAFFNRTQDWADIEKMVAV